MHASEALTTYTSNAASLDTLLTALVGAMILAHNHPSGSPVPSDADRELTRRVRAAGELVGIQLLDHVVITAADWRSVGA